MTTKAPQDRKPPKGTFKGVDGVVHKLPALSENAALKIPAGITMDAIMQPDDDMAQMRLGLATFAACDPTPEVTKALRALSTERMLEVLGEWMGESSGSSESSATTEEPLSTTGVLASA